MTSYKHEHEQFVSGHNGTSFAEILFVTGIPCLSTFTRDSLICIINQQGFLKTSTLSDFGFKFLLDFMLIVLPNILSITVLSDYIAEMFFTIIFFNILLYISIMSQQSSNIDLQLLKPNLSEQKTFITYYRSIIVICTAVGILAVDFPVYPRRLAKAETFGYGLMDTGVGYYIFANAIISPEARGKECKLPLTNTIWRAVKSSLPLFILGFARLISVKGIDYQEHVTEYGVHWNFFFTLAALKIISSVVACFIPSNKAGILAVIVLTLHQTILSMLGGSQYIVFGRDGKGGRDGGLIDANREGVFSLSGCFAIYLCGVCLGRYLFRNRESLMEWKEAAFNIIIAAVSFGVLTLLSHTYLQPVSRRFANATYVFWMICTSLAMLVYCLACDMVLTIMRFSLNQTRTKTKDEDFRGTISIQHITTRSRAKQVYVEHTEQKKERIISGNVKKEDYQKHEGSFCLLQAVTLNSLLYFLLANLMTGFVNMSVATLYTSSATAVLILSVYMFVLSFTVSLLQRHNISTKFW